MRLALEVLGGRELPVFLEENVDVRHATKMGAANVERQAPSVKRRAPSAGRRQGAGLADTGARQGS